MTLNKYQKAWLKNLLSGKYKQGEGYLRRIKGDTYEYCCLGVGYETCGGAWEDGSSAGNACSRTDNRDVFGLSNAYRDLLGISGDDESKLVDMNDSGQSFKRIAKWLKTRWAEMGRSN